MESQRIWICIWSWILYLYEFGSINVRHSESECMFGLICVPHSHPLGIRGSKTFELLQRIFLEVLVRAPRSICERAHRKGLQKVAGTFHAELPACRLNMIGSFKEAQIVRNNTGN